MEALFATAYFPPLDYCRAMLAYRNIGLEAWESYPRQSYRNRCYIDSPNGHLPLSVPVDHRSQSRTGTVLISYRSKWPAEHLQALDTAYGKSPFYESMRAELKLLLQEPPVTLWALNLRILELLRHWLRADWQFTATRQWQKIKSGPDYRETFHPKHPPHWLSPAYPQVFDYKYGFRANLSILDLLSNEGPAAYDILRTL